MTNKEIKIIINEAPRTKKNHGVPITQNGRLIVLPSKAYQQLEKACKRYLQYWKLAPIDYPINLKCLFYKDKDYKADLAGYIQAIQDILVKYKVLEDDNHKIVDNTDGSRVFLDRDNPRIEITITGIANE